MSKKCTAKPTVNTQARVAALIDIATSLLHWSLRRTAKEVRCSPAMLVQMSNGARQPSAEMWQRIKDVERRVANELQDAKELNDLEREWLVAAVERHAQEFTPKEKRRIEKVLRGKE